MEPAHQLLANGSRVSIMKQMLREDIRLHLPRLRQCDARLIAGVCACVCVCVCVCLCACVCVCVCVCVRAWAPA